MVVVIAKLHIDNTILAAEDERLACIDCIEVEPLAGQRSSVQSQHAARHLAQHRLNVGRGIRPIKQFGVKNSVVAWIFEWQIYKSLGHQIDSGGHIKQVGNCAEHLSKRGTGAGLVGHHRRDLGTAHFAIGDPVHLGDLTRTVTADFGAWDVVEIDQDRGIDFSGQTSLDNEYIN